MRLLDHVLKEVKGLKESRQEYILSRRAETYDEYAYLTGVLAGLTLAEGIIEEVRKRLEEYDSED